ncbi:DUF6531 domain-containing protein [Robiginitalea sp. IMCC44478]|uniref:DUF6531 domain-containing protein n=1 Tax=Robiginitalea sp. IMCC44478 TaxID=3459122 RepID=UPI004042E1D9
MKHKILIYVLAICCLGPLKAGVNLKNGNFYVSYTDIKMEFYQTAFKSITRTYNSRASEIGYFGYGWGSNLEDRIHAYPDGTLKVKENGAGSSTYFTSTFATEELLQYMMDTMVEVAIEQGKISNNPEAILKYRNELRNLEYRTSRWDSFVSQGVLEFERDFPEGMEWENNSSGNQKIVRTASGYQRTYGSNRKTEDYDLLGRLIRLDMGDGNYSSLSYEEGNLSEIVNADGSRMKIWVNNEGFITKIKSDNGTATYEYDGKKLIKATDASGWYALHEYNSAYDMTRFEYSTGKWQNMEYDTKLSRIKRIETSGGDETLYGYPVFYKEDGSVDDDHYGTTVTKMGFNGREVTNSYEWVIGTNARGKRYSKIIATTINGIRTSTEYDEVCNMPLVIERGRSKTTFKYNNRCLMIEKLSARGDSVYLRYDDKWDKISYVKNNQGETEFQYDAKGNLVFAQKKGGPWVRLSYNPDGKISSMEQEDKTLLFSYNSINKPASITMEGVGSIEVAYDRNGDIKNVQSAEGHSMALKVTQAFQSLLSLVKPAGVNLNM